MIVFVYGTTAEAIKIAPIHRRLEAIGIPTEHWLTFQHTTALRKIMGGLGLPEPTRILADGRAGEPLRSRSDVVPWLWTIRRWVGRHARRLRAELPPEAIVVVHGDTMTTVVGAYVARRIKRRLAHVEAGLRSGDWRHPFPEELDRRIVGRLADFHYAPSAEAVANLHGRSGVVDTHGNTVIDAVLDAPVNPDDEGEPEFGIALLHRFEYLGNRELVRETMAALSQHSPLPVYFFLDAYARGMVADLLADVDPSRVIVRDKLGHAEFIHVLRRARFVVTDSGGIQEEAALLGIPTLVHRKATERQDGIGVSARLSDWEVPVVIDFLESYEGLRQEPRRPERSPSDIVVEDLRSRLSERRG